MKKICFLIILIHLFPIVVKSQTTFEDTDAKSSIVLYKGGIAQINITDASIKIGYQYYRTDIPIRFGLELSGKNANGIAMLFEKGNFVPETKITLSIGQQWLLSKKPDGTCRDNLLIQDDWLTIQIGYKRAQYSLFIADNIYDNQIEKKNFDGYSIMVFHNILFQGNVLTGISLGYEQQNNYGSLKKIEVTDTKTIYEGEGQLRTTTQTQKLRQGDYIENNHLLANFDIIWVPDFLGEQVGIDFFGRYDGSKDKKIFKPGLGFFILKKGAPTIVLGGITFESVEKKLRIGLIAGLKF